MHERLEPCMWGVIEDLGQPGLQALSWSLKANHLWGLGLNPWHDSFSRGKTCSLSMHAYDLKVENHRPADWCGLDASLSWVGEAWPVDCRMITSITPLILHLWHQYNPFEFLISPIRIDLEMRPITKFLLLGLPHLHSGSRIDQYRDNPQDKGNKLYLGQCSYYL